MYTEEDLRKSFQAGAKRGNWASGGYYYDEPLSEDEYIESLTLKIEKDKICFSYSFLSRKLGWLGFCELTGISEWAKKGGYDPQPNDLFYIEESKARKFNLL